MITRREIVKALAAAPAAAFASELLATLALAAEGEKVTRPKASGKGLAVHLVLRHELPDVPGKQVSVVTVDFAPGAGFQPHRHPGSVFVYVLEGAVISQVEPNKPATYKVGEAWYEPPMHIHRVARNPSKTRPAKIVAFLIADKGQPLTLPVS